VARLPAPVDEGKTEASYDRGVLTVTLGKPTGDGGTEIPVN
jgi:HSP20 family molecular chaperone IbpA